jgi:PAS domain S-box-containing protein
MPGPKKTTVRGHSDAKATPFPNSTPQAAPVQLPRRDIPHGAEAEEKLRCQRAALEAILETTDVKLVYLDRDFNFVKVNRAYADTCKMHTDEMIGKNHFDLYPHEENEKIFRQVRDTGEPVFLKDQPFVFPDQPERGVTYWDWSLVPVKDASKGVIGLVFSLCETTVKKQAEESLRRSELRLRMALDAAFLILFEWDIKRDEVHRWVTNPAILSATEAGVPVKLEDVHKMVHPEDRGIFMDKLQTALKSGEGRYENEFRLIGTGGAIVWLHETGCVERDAEGNAARLIGLSQDITARKNSEDALRAREEDFRAMFEISSVGKALADCQTRRFLRVNNALCGITGYTCEELLSMTIDDLTHPDDGERDRELFERLVRRETDHFETEKRYLRKDGATIWVHVSGNVIRAPEGQPLRSVAVIQDITHQREFQAELERLVSERTARLYELVSELEHFSYSITHDMRAPLRAMRGFAEVMSGMVTEFPQPEMKVFLDRIIGAAERMDTLITDALSYSKAIRQDLPLAPIDAGKLLKGLLDTYPEFLANGTDIVVEGELPCVMGNEAGLVQCFSNLLGNAIKFVPPGKKPSVRVWSEVVEDPHARRSGFPVAEDSSNKWVRIYVEDKGIGISSNMLPRVFQMFAKGAGNYPGTGIGLALVRKVAHRMGGRVGVESEQGKGSRFWIDLIPADRPGAPGHEFEDRHPLRSN